MCWRNRLTVVLLAVLAAGPVFGTMCAAACDSRAMSTIVHHHSTQHCEDADPLPVPQISGTSRHDCTGHQNATIAATVTGRVDIGSTAQSVAVLLVARASSPVQAASPVVASSSPPRTAPPAIPLVLRV